MRVEEVARLVRIDHKLQTLRNATLGGEMQRVAIGRALVRRPAIYLMTNRCHRSIAKLRAELRVRAEAHSAIWVQRAVCDARSG